MRNPPELGSRPQDGSGWYFPRTMDPRGDYWWNDQTQQYEAYTYDDRVARYTRGNQLYLDLRKYATTVFDSTGST